jgi:preprotein translocase subunit SecD
MRTLNMTLFIVGGLLILTGCQGQSGAMEINKTKVGGVYEIVDSGKEFKFYNSDQSFKLDTLTFISFANFEKVQRVKSPYEGVYSLSFKLNDKGKLKFKEMTSRNVHKQICFVMGDKIIAAPQVNDIIPNGQVSIMIADEKGIEEIIKYLKN